MPTKEIVRLYFDEKHSIRQVAQVLNLDKTLVRKILHETGSGVRTNADAMTLRSSDEYRDKLRETQTGIRNHQAKLTESDVVEIRQLYDELITSNTKTQSQHMLAKRYGVKRPTISDVVLRKTWKHI